MNKEKYETFPKWASELYEVMPRLGAAFARGRSLMPESLKKGFETGDLGSRHISVLNQVIASGGSSSVTDISIRLGLSLSATSQLVGELSRVGYIDRIEDPDDRRRTLVGISDKHGISIQEYIQQRAAPLIRAAKKLSPQERASFLKGIYFFLEEMDLGTEFPVSKKEL